MIVMAYMNSMYVYMNILSFYVGQLIRLVGGSVKNQGRIEVRVNCNSNWGTVCRHFWGIIDARVACHQLGYKGNRVTSYYYSARFGNTSSNRPILLDNLGCTGTEKSLFDCQHNGVGIHNCDHSDDIGILCDKSKLFMNTVAIEAV